MLNRMESVCVSLCDYQHHVVIELMQKPVKEPQLQHSRLSPGPACSSNRCL